MAESNGNIKGYETKAIHSGQEFDQWGNLELVTPIVTSMTFYQNDPTNITVSSSKLIFSPRKRITICFLHFDFIGIGILLLSCWKSDT